MIYIYTFLNKYIHNVKDHANTILVLQQYNYYCYELFTQKYREKF